MPDIRALNSKVHRNLRVIIKRGAEYGENTHYVPVVADELRNLVLEYPVILLKEPRSGRFNLCAMLGFEQGENLFLDGEKWDANYIPAHIFRQPFSLTYTAKTDEGRPDPESVIVSIDVESNRVQEEEGERLFDDEGNQTDFLREINGMLAGIGNAVSSTDAFVKKLAEKDLIEAANLDVQFAGGESKRFDGIYMVNEEKLSKIEGDELAELYKAGYLQAAWLMLTSFGNVRKLLLRRAARDGIAPQG